ncbi:hypothetical protein TWF481_010442 [Arthrobotrys musiformis]|uniref:Vacuolar calcium ion transporter n=1 Tax=Arthrobotrys musiformis TaxID=47236 RepID=A0AAV9W1X0_9PEZI
MSGPLAGVSADPPLRSGDEPAEASLIRNTIFSRYTNILLAFVPLGLAAGAFSQPAVAVFALNFLAIVPLAPLITLSIDELLSGVGHNFGKLMKPTSGNLVEMIVGITALAHGKPLVARSSLLGSILAYALLFLGSNFFVAGYDKKEVTFEKTVTNTLSSWAMVVSFSLIVPTVVSVTSHRTDAHGRAPRDIQALSHAISIVLIITFVVYLKVRTWFLDTNANRDHDATHENCQRAPGANSRSRAGLRAAAFVLFCAMLSAILCASHLIGSIDSLAKVLGTNETFISLVLIPPISYSARCFNTIALARGHRMDTVIRFIIHSILQLTTLLIPLMVLLGWLFKEPFSLDFGLFQATVFFTSIFTMSSITQHGKSNYFYGIMLIGTYILVAVAFHIRPGVWEEFVLPGLDRRRIAHGLYSIESTTGEFGGFEFFKAAPTCSA